MNGVTSIALTSGQFLSLNVGVLVLGNQCYVSKVAERTVRCYWSE